MLTTTQKDMLKKLKDGKVKVDPKEKADFYYRMSKILKNEFESIGELTMLLDEIPDSYLEKIDFYAVAIDSLKLLEKFIMRVEPAPAYGDGEERRVIRNFRVKVDNPLPGVVLSGDAPSIAFVAVTYKPTDSEVELVDELKKLKDHIEGSMHYSAEGITNYTTEEFDKIKKKLESKQNFEVRMRGITADNGKDQKEEPK